MAEANSGSTEYGRDQENFRVFKVQARVKSNKEIAIVEENAISN